MNFNKITFIRNFCTINLIIEKILKSQFSYKEHRVFIAR